MVIPLVGREAEYARIRSVLDGEGPGAVALVGDSGVGKSRLLRELGAEATSSGWNVRWVYGSAPLRTIPFAALVHAFGPAAESANPLEVMAGARRALVGRGGGRTLLLVDDAHDLDEGSLGLIDQVVRHGDARVAIGTRRPVPWPRGLGSLVERSRGVYLDVLDRDAVAELTREMVGDEPSESLVDDLWERTCGLPLFVVVLLEGAIAEEGLAWTDRGVDIPEGLPISPLRQLIENRVRLAGAGARRVVELIAVGGPIPRATLGQLGLESDLDLARREGIVVESGDVVEAAHPIYVETLRPTSRDHFSRVAAEVFGALPPPDGARDRIRTALLAMEAGLSMEADKWARAAIDALERLDPLLAGRFAQKAVAADPGHVPAQIALGKALAFSGDIDGATSVLRRVVPRNGTERTSRATALAHVLAFGAGQAGEAMELLAVEAENVGEAERLILDNQRALYAAVSGSFREVLVAGERVLLNDSATPRVRLDAGTNVALARVMLGALDEVDSLLDENDALAGALSDERPLASLQNGLIRTAAEHGRGRLAEAQRQVNHHIEDRFDASWLQWKGILLDQVGLLKEAVEAQRAAVAAYESSDPFGLRTQAIGVLGMHLGQMGSVSAADAAIVADAERRGRGEMRLAAWTVRGQAWVDCATVGPEIGAARALDLGGWLVDHDHVLWGVFALHDAVRMGAAPTDAVDAMAGCVGEMSGATLGMTMWKHVHALATGDAGALAEAAREFQRCGAIGLAREAWAQLAAHLCEVGELPSACRAATHSQLLAGRVPEQATPSSNLAVVGITRRELEVVSLVLLGKSNREIAADLYLSPRTVENHLYAVYQKLELSGREELIVELSD